MIVFLGAGASSPFGIPTMPEFTKILDKEMSDNALYNEVKNNFDERTFDLEVLMTVLEDLSYNREELFSRMSPQTSAFMFQNARKKGINYFDRVVETDTARKCSAEVKRVIRRECLKATQNNVNTILKVYDQLFNFLSASRGLEIAQRLGSFVHAGDERLMYPRDLKIFTTNYDTCIETYLNRRQVDFTQGIKPRFGYNIFDVDSYDDKDNKVGVFKLHGSVDLFKKDGDIRQFHGFPADSGLTYLGEEFGEEFMRYPIEFGGYHHVIESPYLDMFRLFRDRIKMDYQSLWLLIGSEFRDLTICSIMNDVLRLKERSQHPLIVLINPKAKTIVTRLKQWGMSTFAELIRQVEVKFGTDEYIAELQAILNPKQQS